ncbi:NTP transferase domain-containing protein [Tropicimonas aquimaris]|uniref:NTP transferase domain-containing protein n=1 Tax=Tropicimonas aquimaris TaxID=914152 RepID=A0ABW3IUT1_9RHOB
MTRVGLILAAGRSARFGSENKLLAPFRGRPLAACAAEAMRGVALDHRLVVTSSAEVAALFEGFERVPGAGDMAGQADNLRAGVARARALGADRLLIALADMPLVGAEVMQAVLERCGATCASAVTDGRRRMPPACFPQSDLAALSGLQGDRGAGALLRGLPSTALVTVAADVLADVDTVADLAALAASSGHEPGNRP